MAISGSGVTPMWPKSIQQQDASIGPFWVPHSQNAPTNQLRVITTSTTKSPKNPHFYPLRGVKCNKKFQAAKITTTHPNHFWFAASVPILSKFGWLVFENLTILPFFCYRDKSPLKNEPASRGPSPRPECTKRYRADHPGQAGWCIGF